jgi:XTP/dITP diphosphohydrolase
VARLAVATGNAGKLEEFRELLASTGFVLEGWAPDVAEDRDSYEGNAVLKAEAAAAACGLPALGDDSGVEVDALGGFPGLHSARIAPAGGGAAAVDRAVRVRARARGSGPAGADVHGGP